jgi:hypothetical protein
MPPDVTLATEGGKVAPDPFIDLMNDDPEQGVDPDPSELTCLNSKHRKYHEMCTSITRMV